MAQDFETAIRLYQASIKVFPTAEAYTFLGWAYSFQGEYDRAVTECPAAIAVDSTSGNPYNDIGSYLLPRAIMTIACAGLNLPC